MRSERVLTPATQAGAGRSACWPPRKGPVTNKFAFYGRRGARLARREEGAYRQYSTDEERRQTGWIGGHKREVILDRALGPGTERVT